MDENIAKGLRKEFGLDWDFDLQIDPHKLDEEWLDQPRLMMRYCELCAEAIEEYDTAKLTRDLVKAQTGHDARIDPDSFDIGKATEPAIKEALTLDKESIQAERKAIKAKYRAALLQSATRCLEQRKVSLENLVYLHGQNYYSEPEARGPSAKEVLKDAGHKETHERIKKSRRTRRKESTDV